MKVEIKMLMQVSDTTKRLDRDGRRAMIKDIKRKNPHITDVKVKEVADDYVLTD